MSTDMPEVVAITADEAYHDNLEGRCWTESLDVRVAAEIKARHTAYAKVWQAGREPLALLVEASRKLLAEIVDIGGEGGGLGSTVIRDARRLVGHIHETLGTEPASCCREPATRACPCGRTYCNDCECDCADWHLVVHEDHEGDYRSCRQPDCVRIKEAPDEDEEAQT